MEIKPETRQGFLLGYLQGVIYDMANCNSYYVLNLVCKVGLMLVLHEPGTL